MTIATWPRTALVVTAAVSLLAGCNGGAPLSPAVDGSAARPASKAAAGAPRFSVTRDGVVIQRRNHEASYMIKPLTGQDLLYVSDAGAADVEVYDYPQGTLVGTITGFSYPQGECADTQGNVYVVDTGSSQIFEYAHGGTSPLNILSDSGETPASCAVDPNTGNLAVSNILSATQFEIGSISVYTVGNYTPTVYTDSDNAREYFLAYDNNSNIFVDGVDSVSNAFRFAEMSTAGKFTEIKLKGGKLTFPGGVQTLGKNIAVGDQDGAVWGTPDIYQVLQNGKVVRRTTLTGPNGGRVGDPVQFTIAQKQIVAPDALGGAAFLDTWPKGKYLSSINSGLVAPIAAVISKPSGK